MNTDDLPPPGLLGLAEETWRLRHMLRDAQARLVFNLADPDGDLTQVARMLALKRGSRR